MICHHIIATGYKKKSLFCIFKVLTVFILLGFNYQTSAVNKIDKPSVILITIDTLRADRIPLNIDEHPLSPAISALIKRGTVFKWAFSTSGCTAPSHVSILSGKYPSYHSISHFNRKFAYTDKHPLLAEHFKKAGYKTAAIVSNPVLDKSLGLTRGFDQYNDIMTDREINRNVFERKAASTALIALKFLKTHKDQPFFLWIHFQDPHGPYTPPEKFLSKPVKITNDPIPLQKILKFGTDNSGLESIPVYQRIDSEQLVSEYLKRYHGEIAYLDSSLSQIVQYLDQTQYFKKNLLVVTSDHGEAFGEDGFYFSHSHSVALDQVHVPLIFVGEEISSNIICKTPISNKDIYGTLIAYAALSERTSTDSVNLLDESQWSDWNNNLPIYFESPNQIGMVFQSVFFRKDREETKQADFWSNTNPNTGGTWKALNSEMLNLEKKDVISEEKKEKIQALISQYEKKARLFESKRKLRRRLSPNLSSKLNALGYTVESAE